MIETNYESGAIFMVQKVKCQLNHTPTRNRKIIRFVPIAPGFEKPIIQNYNAAKNGILFDSIVVRSQIQMSGTLRMH